MDRKSVNILVLLLLLLAACSQAPKPTTPQSATSGPKVIGTLEEMQKSNDILAQFFSVHPELAKDQAAILDKDNKEVVIGGKTLKFLITQAKNLEDSFDWGKDLVLLNPQSTGWDHTHGSGMWYNSSQRGQLLVVYQAPPISETLTQEEQNKRFDSLWEKYPELKGQGVETLPQDKAWTTTVAGSELQWRPNTSDYLGQFDWAGKLFYTVNEWQETDSFFYMNYRGSLKLVLKPAK